MILFCDLPRCVHCRSAQCQQVELCLEDGKCIDYEDVTDGPDYSETYWIACEWLPLDGAGGVKYRQKRRGKMIEFEGLTLYTQDDIRDGIDADEITFTEARTGYRIKGSSLLDPVALNMIKKRYEVTPDVMSLPWMDGHMDGPPTPHEE